MRLEVRALLKMHVTNWAKYLLEYMFSVCAIWISGYVEKTITVPVLVFAHWPIVSGFQTELKIFLCQV